MLGQLDHVVYLSRDLGDASQVLRGLPGCSTSPLLAVPDWVAVDADGIWTAEYRMHGAAVEFVAPAHHVVDPARSCPGLLRKFEASGAGYKSLVFGTDDLDREHARLHAAGFEPGEITTAGARHFDSGERREWRRFRCADEPLHGLKVFVIERAASPAVGSGAPTLGSVEIETRDLDRACQLWRDLLGSRETARPTADSVAFPLGSTSLSIRKAPDTADDAISFDRILGVHIR